MHGKGLTVFLENKTTDYVIETFLTIDSDDPRFQPATYIQDPFEVDRHWLGKLSRPLQNIIT